MPGYRGSYRGEPGSGGGGAGVTDLQGAYDGGNSIDTSSDTPVEINYDGLGVGLPAAGAAGTEEGLTLTNNTAGAAGTRQVSPPITWEGQGWDTVPGVSAECRARAYVYPLESNPPRSALLFETWSEAAGANYDGGAMAIGQYTAGYSAATYFGGVIYTLGAESTSWGTASNNLSISYDQNHGVGLGNAANVYHQGSGNIPVAFINQARTDGASNEAFDFTWDTNSATAPAGRIAEFGWTDNANVFNYTQRMRGDGGIDWGGHQFGGGITFGKLEEATSVGNGVTIQDTTIAIPADAKVFAVATRVVTQPGGTSTFDCGVAGDTQRFAATVSTATGTTDVGTDDSLSTVYASSANVRFTFDSGTTDGSGVIRTVIYYYTITPPTS